MIIPMFGRVHASVERCGLHCVDEAAHSIAFRILLHRLERAAPNLGAAIGALQQKEVIHSAASLSEVVPHWVQ